MREDLAELKGSPNAFPETGRSVQGDIPPRPLHPFVAAQANYRELTIIPLLMGVVLGLVFGASSLYLVLKVGLTVSASIPLAVISITLFRFLSLFGLRGRTILENNIVQTAGSAGESIAFGIGVTMPAIMILGFDLDVINVLLVATIGGLLGILLMIPLRRRFIVLNHAYLKYPEGTACAEILAAGATNENQTPLEGPSTASDIRPSAREFSASSNSKTVFVGFGISFVYQTLMSVLKLWKDFSERVFGRPFEGASISIENNPALLGVGYIIGPRIASIMTAGGAFSYLMLVPLIKYFGGGGSTPLLPATSRISEMSVSQIRSAYILYIGAGAVVAGGLLNLFRSLPTILRGVKSLRTRSLAQKHELTQKRTDRDIPKTIIVAGVIMLAMMSMVFRSLNINFLGMLLMVSFSFLFVRVSARLTGEVGASVNPISGMTVATLLLVCLVFFFVGWTSPPYYVAALSIGAIVCIAASSGGTASQVLKTGQLVGATPRNQQLAILIGALFSALVLGHVLVKLNETGTVYIPRVGFEKVDGKTQLSTAQITTLPRYEEEAQPPVPSLYRLLRVESGAKPATAGLEVGDYLVDELSGKIVYHQQFNFPLTHVDISRLTKTQKLSGPEAEIDRNTYHVLQGVDSPAERRGKYLVDEKGYAVYLVDPGINGVYAKRSDGTTVEKFDAPKATLMAYIIKGILNREFPWGLVLLGMMLAITVELSGIPSLPFAVGLYLPFSSSTPILIGGIIRWLVEKRVRSKTTSETEEFVETDQGPGVMLSSGFIAGAAVAGILIAFIAGLLSKINASMEDWSRQNNPFFEGTYSDFLAFLVFMLLGCLLYLVGRGVLLSDRRPKRV
jgi:putative OPT family oligopeptide transporter